MGSEAEFLHQLHYCSQCRQLNQTCHQQRVSSQSIRHINTPNPILSLPHLSDETSKITSHRGSSKLSIRDQKGQIKKRNRSRGKCYMGSKSPLSQQLLHKSSPPGMGAKLVQSSERQLSWWEFLQPSSICMPPTASG